MLDPYHVCPSDFILPFWKLPEIKAYESELLVLGELFLQVTPPPPVFLRAFDCFARIAV